MMVRAELANTKTRLTLFGLDENDAICRGKTRDITQSAIIPGEFEGWATTQLVGMCCAIPFPQQVKPGSSLSDGAPRHEPSGGCRAYDGFR